jgi:hypothetical protein
MSLPKARVKAVRATLVPPTVALELVSTVVGPLVYIVNKNPEHDALYSSPAWTRPLHSPPAWMYVTFVSATFTMPYAIHIHTGTSCKR